MFSSLKKLLKKTFMEYSKTGFKYTKIHRLAKPAHHEIKLFGIPKSTRNDRMEGKHIKIKEKFQFSNRNRTDDFYGSKVSSTVKFVSLNVR